MPTFRTGNNLFCLQWQPGEWTTSHVANTAGHNSGFRGASPELYYRQLRWPYILGDPKFSLILPYRVNGRVEGYAEQPYDEGRPVYAAPRFWWEVQQFQAGVAAPPPPVADLIWQQSAVWGSVLRRR